VKTRVIRLVIMTALSATALAFTGCASERYRYHDNYYDHGSAHQAHAYGVQNGSVVSITDIHCWLGFNANYC
jgi:hypothetical protein